MTSDATWESFVASIAADVDVIAETTRRIGELASYRGIPEDELLPSVRRNIAVALQGLVERRQPRSDEDLSPFAKSGEHRARQGVTLADMLRGWSIGLEASRASAYRHAPTGPRREALLLEAIEIMTAWNTVGTNASAETHRQVELELARHEQHDLSNLVRRVLFGRLDAAQRGRLDSFGIDPAAEYYAVRARPDERSDAGTIELWLGAEDSAERRNGLAALLDGDVAGFVSTLPESATGPVAVGVAGPVSLTELPDAFRRASRALETAHAIGRRGVVDLTDLGLTPALLADDDVAAGVLERYVVPLERAGRAGVLVLDTVDTYLHCESRVHATAAKLDVHPNTVRYRIARFEALSGCSLRNSEQLVEAWWALRSRELTRRSAPAEA